MSKPSAIIVWIDSDGTYDEKAEAIERITRVPLVVGWQTNNWRIGQAVQRRGRIAFSWLGRHTGHRVVEVP